MKHSTVAALFAIAGMLAVFPAQADHDVYGIRDRLEHQQAVIERGIETGALTRYEAMSLQREQREIRELAADLRQAGTSHAEREQILDARLDRAERHIRKSLHDQDEHRAAYPPGADHDRPYRDGNGPEPSWER